MDTLIEITAPLVAGLIVAVVYWIKARRRKPRAQQQQAPAPDASPVHRLITIEVKADCSQALAELARLQERIAETRDTPAQ